MGRTALVPANARFSPTIFVPRKFIRLPCVLSVSFVTVWPLLPISCACVQRSLPGAKVPCEKRLSEAHASTPSRCCVRAEPIQLSSCGCGRACCRGLPTCVFFLRRCLSSVQPDQLPTAAPWTVLWQWPAWLIWRHVCLHECGGFPRAQIHRPVCWVICLRACPVPRVPEFLSRASHPPC
jgi:hypothetical protein